MIQKLRVLLSSEIAGGLLLGFAAILAIIIANSPFEYYYNMLLSAPVVVQVGALEIAKPLLLWVNDGLMAVFFFLVGLELKRECMQGELNDWRKAVLPGLGAIGGMIAPAIVYLIFNYEDPVARNGWAIPAATDIAFALGVLLLLGPKVPFSLKIFLTTLAIFDDVGAIIIIAFFYSTKISIISLIVSVVAAMVLFAMNRVGVLKKAPYIFVGVIMWIAVLKSGVHATLAGVVLALFIPLTPSPHYKEGNALKSLERDLHWPVIYLILPFFAFCNSGLSFAGMGANNIIHPVPLGIALGLFVGKQVGVFSFCWLSIKLGLARMPSGTNFMQLYGVSLLTGIGFTMSLFIGSLAFEDAGTAKLFDERVGILMGSIISGIAGYCVLKSQFSKRPASTFSVVAESH